jgi:predicted metal-dependent HD superfamily phosphohydrolase
VLAVLDADMSILGMDVEIYKCYQENIRKEFSHTPKFLYSHSRKKFIRSILKQPFIYHLDWFQSKFEKQARKNMADELKSL